MGAGGGRAMEPEYVNVTALVLVKRRQEQALADQDDERSRLWVVMYLVVLGVVLTAVGVVWMLG